MNRNPYEKPEGEYSEPIPIETTTFICPRCKGGIEIAKTPEWMGSSFYEDMCKMKDEQLSFAYKRIRELEEKYERYGK